MSITDIGRSLDGDSVWKDTDINACLLLDINPCLYVYARVCVYVCIDIDMQIVKEFWADTPEWSKASKRRLAGDVLVTTAFLSYAGPFNQEYRTKMMITWYKMMDTRKVPYTQELDVTTWLVDNATVSHMIRCLLSTYLNIFDKGSADIRRYIVVSYCCRFRSGTSRDFPTTNSASRTAWSSPKHLVTHYWSTRKARARSGLRTGKLWTSCR